MAFSQFTCVQCTRRLSRLASHPIRRQVTPQLSHKHDPLFTTHRYSTRKVARTVTTRDSFAKIHFTPADVPPRAFWEHQVGTTLFADLSADECLHAVQAYADAALKNAPGWRERLIAVNATSPPRSSDGGGKGRRTLSTYTLHYVALMIVMSPTGSARHLAMHILHTLSGLDYTPSILTMVRMALARDLLGQPQFEPAFERLERIVKRIGDGSSDKSVGKDGKPDFAADACTLRALIYEREHTFEADKNALRWFRRAFELRQATPSAADQVPPEGKRGDGVDAGKGAEDAPFDPHWQWKVSFALGVGRIRMRRGEMEKARHMLSLASSELDNAEAYRLMADVLEEMGETDTDKYAESLEKAAISGDQGAARKMGTREWDRAAEAGLSKWEKRKRQVVAEEWMALAGSGVPAER